VGDNAASSASPGAGSAVTLGDPNGVSSPYSWYLAGVQAKVRAIWLSQLHPGFVTPIEIQFTILEDGSLIAPTVVTPSGSIALDLAATRAIVSAAPFAPLPKDLQAKPFTIRAQFRAER
jgi:TonB family protein